jgi:hypothetical protein
MHRFIIIYAIFLGLIIIFVYSLFQLLEEPEVVVVVDVEEEDSRGDINIINKKIILAFHFTLNIENKDDVIININID